MTEVLAIFCGLPFLFLVGTAFAPGSVIRSIGNKERFTRITWYSVATFCLFPLYLFISVATTVWTEPMGQWPIDVVFQVIVAVLSLILIFNMRILARDAYTSAFAREIFDDIRRKSRNSAVDDTENDEGDSPPSIERPPSSNTAKRPGRSHTTTPKRTPDKKR